MTRSASIGKFSQGIPALGMVAVLAGKRALSPTEPVMSVGADAGAAAGAASLSPGAAMLGAGSIDCVVRGEPTGSWLGSPFGPRMRHWLAAVAVFGRVALAGSTWTMR